MIQREGNWSVSINIARFEQIAQLEKAGAEKSTPTKAPAQVKPTPQEMRAAVTQELRSTNHTSFVGRSQTAWGHLTSNNPEMSAKIDAFKQAHPEKMQLIQESKA